MLVGRDQLKADFDRLMARGSLGHAYLFFGEPQAGKFTFAKALAERVERGVWPDEVSLRPLTDVLTVVPSETGTIGIEEARAVKAFLMETPFIGPRRTVIIDRADALTTEAQNALLKVTEEPPASSLLLFVASDPELLMPTLVSRLSNIYMPAVKKKDIVDLLVHENGLAAREAEKIAAGAGGRPGLAMDIASGAIETREKNARSFLSVPKASRRDFLKALLEPEDFNFREFLDSLILVLSREDRRNSALWHAVVKLRQMADATGLNPRIQLNYIWTLI